MRAACSWLLSVAIPMLFIACGGGGGEEQAQTEAQPQAEMTETTTPEGYQVVAVTNGGTISGTITYSGKAPKPQKLPVTKDVQVCGQREHYDQSLVVAENSGIKDAVVSIKNISSGKSMDALGTNFVLDQKGCLYSPHVLLMPVNTTLKILNPDGILHNIHTYSEKNPPFNKSQPKFKKEMETSFEYPELINVKCDVHGWMSANIYVVDHPYHAKTDVNGHYVIADVPPGNYEVKVWQEKLGTHTMQVTVGEGATTTLDHAYPAMEAASD